MDDEKTSAEELTSEEVEQEQEVGATPEEEHRLGEYEELKALLESVITKLDSLASSVGDITSVANSVSVDNGATFNDEAAEAEADSESDVEIADTVEDPRDRDYSIER